MPKCGRYERSDIEHWIQDFYADLKNVPRGGTLRNTDLNAYYAFAQRWPGTAVALSQEPWMINLNVSLSTTELAHLFTAATIARRICEKANNPALNNMLPVPTSTVSLPGRASRSSRRLEGVLSGAKKAKRGVKSAVARAKKKLAAKSKRKTKVRKSKVRSRR